MPGNGGADETLPPPHTHRIELSKNGNFLNILRMDSFCATPIDLKKKHAGLQES